MIKVNLQNIAVNNMLTGQNTLDSIFIDGNSILFITKPEYLKQLYRDEIRARSIKMNLKIAREEIHKRTQDDRYNNLDDMETLKKFRAQTDELRKSEREYRRMLSECENVKRLITGNAKGWVNQIIKAFGDAGYDVQGRRLEYGKGVPGRTGKAEAG